MPKICTALLVLFCAPAVFAQEPAADVDFDISTGYATKVMTLPKPGNNFVVFYEEQLEAGKTVSLNLAILGSDGVLAKPKSLASKINASEWTAAWSEVAKSYMVVCRKGKTLIARMIRANGKPGKSKQVTNLSSGKFVIAAAANKMFVVFLARSNRIAVQALRSTGKKFHKEKTLTSKSDLTVFPVAAVTNNKGSAVCYASFHNAKTKSTRCRFLAVDYKLRVRTKFFVSSTMTTEDGDFCAGFNPESKTHFVSWYADNKNTYYMFNSQGEKVCAETEIDDYNRKINQFVYHPVEGNVTPLLAYQTQEGGTIPTLKQEYYFSYIDGQGKSAGTALLFVIRNRSEVKTMDIAIGQDGKKVLLWCYDRDGDGDHGIHGAVIYKSN